MQKSKYQQVLLGQINDTRHTLEIIYKRYVQIRKNRDIKTAIFIGKVFENYYTCLETLFLKISQTFENSLDSARWHKDLLEKMIIKINGTREAVITRESYTHLREFLEFRHFYRYYVEMDYDWEKLHYLQKKFSGLHTMVMEDLNQFSKFLEKM